MLMLRHDLAQSLGRSEVMAESLKGINDAAKSKAAKDRTAMESVVLGILRGRGLTLGLAESVTGGLVGGRLTNVPGSSSVFRGAVVSYASDVKFGVLGVERGPVVSEEAAAQMARGAQQVLGCDVALALSGVAGPDEQDGRPVGDRKSTRLNSSHT